MLGRMIIVLTVGAMMVWTSPVFAHAALKESAPTAGATVPAPQSLTLTFTEKVRLTAVRLVAGDKTVPLETDRAAPAAVMFSLPLSSLTPGSYQVRWTAIGADGHPVNGTFRFTVSQTTS